MNFKEDIKNFRENHKANDREIGNAVFRYWLSGDGEHTYVLLPGGMGSGEFFYNQILALEKYGKVLTLDYPIQLKDNNSMADGIVALVDSLGLERAIYIGQSYGGMIAQVIAKRHPEKIFGLVLSNTGTASDKVIPSDEGLQKMILGQKKGLEVLKTAPYDQVEQHMLKKMRHYLDPLEEKYKKYINDIFEAMVKALPRERNLLMTGLLFDFHQNQRFTQKDFKKLQGRVMLVFSPDDKTFSEAVRSELISLMPNPIVNSSLTGGHLAITVMIDDFINSILNFQKSIDETIKF